MTTPTSPKPHTPADPTVSKDPGTTLDNGARNAGLRTALTKLADELTDETDAARDAWERGYQRAQRLLGGTLRRLLAAHPAPVSEVTLKVDDAKMLRETLAVAQTATSGFAYTRIDEHVDRIQGLIDQLDVHRPLGADGKHGDRHTATCGCDDAPVSDTRREDVTQVDLVADTLAKAFEGPHCTAADLHGADCTTPGGCYYHDAARAVLAVLPAPPVLDEAEVRERIAQDIEAVDPIEWALAGQRAGEDAARIARGATR